MKEFFDLASQHGFTLVFAVAMLWTIIVLLRILANFLQKVWQDREERIKGLETAVTVIQNGQREAVLGALVETRKTNSDIVKGLDALTNSTNTLNDSVAKLTTRIESQPCHMMREEFVPLLTSIVEKVSINS